MAYMRVHADGSKVSNQLDADTHQKRYRWYIIKDLKTSGDGVSYLFCNWGSEQITHDTILQSGTFDKLWPSWVSIVLMCTGKEPDLPEWKS